MTSPLYSQHIAHLQQQTERILAKQGFDRLLIHSGRTRMRFQDDHGPAFRAHPYFVHWLPLPQHEDGLLEIQPGRKPRVYLHVPDDFWHAPPAPPESWWADEFDIQIVKHPDQWRRVLDEPKASALIAEPMDFPELGQHAALNPAQLLLQLDEHRTVKSEWQIDCMRESNRIAALGHQAAVQAFFDGKSELEIHFEYLHASLHEPNELSYNSIVALNEHAAVLHYQYRDERAPHKHHSFLIDAGADHLGYACDITRTHVAGDTPASNTFRSLIEQMNTLQLGLVEQVQAGQDYVALNERTHRGLAEILKLQRRLGEEG
ncbi:MAG: M24 family metallopeptidase, partial [Pseudomonadota bacterium]